MKNEFAKEIKEIYEALEKSNIDFYGLDEYSFEQEFIQPFKEKYQKTFGWNNGATKGVLIFQDYGFVIKVPFTDCDGDEMYGANVYNEDDHWNYCQAELERYERSCEKSIQDAFAEIEFLFEIPKLNYPLYIQRFCKIATYDDQYQNYSAEVSTTNSKNSYLCIDGTWENRLYELKGRDFFCKVKDFIKEEQINDLRRANIGYYNGTPVLVDYAGFDG